MEVLAGTPKDVLDCMSADSRSRIQRVLRMVDLHAQCRENALLSPEERVRRADEMAKRRDLHRVGDRNSDAGTVVLVVVLGMR